jgi:hypothetical protein
VLATAAAAGVGAAPAPGTKPCPYCGEQILQTAIKCRFCSTDLTAPRQQQGGVVVTGPAAGTGQAPSIVIQNVQAAQPSFVPGQQVKNPGIAMLLSIIFPGGGQFYNGHIGKGILILCTSWLILPWVYGIFDAYSSANRINRVGF